MASPLRALADERTVVLTTFRRDGRAVPTPMSIVLDGDRAFMRTWSTSGKMKRLRRDPSATVAPSTARGQVTGTAYPVRAVVVTGRDADRAASLLARKHPVLHGLAVPVAHRVTRRQPVYLELLPQRGSEPIRRAAPGVPDDPGAEGPRVSPELEGAARSSRPENPGVSWGRGRPGCPEPRRAEGSPAPPGSRRVAGLDDGQGDMSATAAATSKGAQPSTVPERGGLVLLSLILVAAVANLNLSVANVALPSIGLAFDASQTALDLVAVGYSLGLAASVLWLGALGDRYGRKLMLILGVVLSVPACLLAAFAPTDRGPRRRPPRSAASRRAWPTRRRSP